MLPGAFRFTIDHGEVPERLKGTVLKTVVAYPHRGFESHPLRHKPCARHQPRKASPPVKLTAALVAVAALTLTAACREDGEGTATRGRDADLATRFAGWSLAATPTPDLGRVIGVVLRCGGASGALSGTVCVGDPSAYQDVTVLTASGATYTVKANATQRISLGQVWP